uniref:uncharacterized protein LOC117153687 n=1 Tax=Bombus vancouverensis nearcticus TaxID=2705178 RepID=UPI00143A9ED3|nr:uncharacterized protein LOC117153687 [Bombus vancouverensis nearcticus]
MAAGDADKPGSTGNRPDPAKFWHGFRSQARGPRPRKPGRHGSWATSHRETARDRHIHAARFTTIKMGAAECRIVLSPACIEESIRFIGQQLRHRNGNHHVSKDDFDVETIILIRVISRLLR